MSKADRSVLERVRRVARHADASTAVTTDAAAFRAAWRAAQPVRRIGRAWWQRGAMVLFIGLAMGAFSLILQLSVPALFDEAPHTPIALLLHWGAEPWTSLAALWLPAPQTHAEFEGWVLLAAASLALNSMLLATVAVAWTDWWREREASRVQQYLQQVAPPVAGSGEGEGEDATASRR